ncbi:MAG TPA: hydroxymethylbilane synthase [Solirubrobacteraceae bacterium]|jgi:hydroxymethylbilane synthase|nr:hydroxymethylbilane synthase [Solirubrobacteraceae bacterium]
MRLGTRASALALAQAELVAELLQAGGDGGSERGGAAVEIVPIVTRGDRESAGVDDTAGALAGDGAPGEPPPGEDKSRWVSELEHALSDGVIDVAVHSAKDVPGDPVDGLTIVAAPPRAGAEDALCGASGLSALKPGARVGTSSVRRVAQLLAAREDLVPVGIRGNVDTRLAKLARGELDAIVIARAGLQRLGREDAVGAVLDPARFVPAPGQGTLALQARSDDAGARDALAAIGSAHALSCLLAERAVARALGASCDTPLGAHAVASDRTLRLRAWVGLPDGSAWLVDELHGTPAEPEELGSELAKRLDAVGAGEMLERAAQMAVAK